MYKIKLNFVEFGVIDLSLENNILQSTCNLARCRKASYFIFRREAPSMVKERQL